MADSVFSQLGLPEPPDESDQGSVFARLGLPEPPGERQSKPGIISDLAKSFATGAMQGAGMFFQGGGEALAGAINRVTGTKLRAEDPFQSLGWEQGLLASRSPESIQAEAESMPTGSITEPSTWSFGKNPSVRGYANLAANTLGQVAPNVAQAVMMAKASPTTQFLTGAGFGGVQAYGGGAQQERDAINAMTPEQLVKASTGYAELINRGMDPQQAKAIIAERAAVGGGLGNAGPSALEGGAEDLLVSGVLGGRLKIPGKSLASRIAKGVVGGAITEGTEEGIEQASQNVGSNIAIGGNRPVGEDTFNQVLLGAIPGAVLGVGGGAISHLNARAEERAKPPAPAPQVAPQPGAVEPAPVAGLLGPSVIQGQEPSGVQAIARQHEIDAAQANADAVYAARAAEEARLAGLGVVTAPDGTRVDKTAGPLSRATATAIEGGIVGQPQVQAPVQAEAPAQAAETPAQAEAVGAEAPLQAAGGAGTVEAPAVPQTPMAAASTAAPAPVSGPIAAAQPPLVSQTKAPAAVTQPPATPATPVTPPTQPGLERMREALRQRMESRVDQQAHEAAASPLNTRPEPTPAQAEAGNYKKGHVSIAGMDISIENPQGSTRTGTDANGKTWSSPMQSGHYGYFLGTIGKDKDHVDVIVKPGTPENYAGKVFVVDQQKPGGALDEHKVMLGFGSNQEARDAYLANYEKGWKGLKSMAEFANVDAFKNWLANADKKQAARDWVVAQNKAALAKAKETAQQQEAPAGRPSTASKPMAGGIQVQLRGTAYGDYLVHSAKQVSGESGWMVTRVSDGETVSGTRAIKDQVVARQLAERFAAQQPKETANAVQGKGQAPAEEVAPRETQPPGKPPAAVEAKPAAQPKQETPNAVQEQGPSPGVLRPGRPEVGLQQVGEGNQKPQEPAARAKPEAQPAEASAQEAVKDIPPLYFTRTQVPVEIWIEDEGKSETVKLPASEALADVRKERDAYQRLLDCLRSAA